MSWAHFASTKSDEIENFVNSQHPELDGIQGSLSHGNTFHVWVRTGDNSRNTYRLTFTGPWGDGMSQQIEMMLETNRAKILSFNKQTPPHVWYFEQQEIPDID